MKHTNKSKRVQGRPVPVVEIETLKRKVVKFGTGGAHVTLPNLYLDREAEVKILSLRPFVCSSCLETISHEENFSPDPKLCIACYNGLEYLKKNKDKLKCRECKKKISGEQFKNAWFNELCEDCYFKEDPEAIPMDEDPDAEDLNMGEDEEGL